MFWTLAALYPEDGFIPEWVWKASSELLLVASVIAAMVYLWRRGPEWLADRAWGKSKDDADQEPDSDG